MPLELQVGSTFAGHRIDAFAARGGMGVVYLATDLTLDRPVALKLIAPALAEDPLFRARFGTECKLTAALDHPSIVEVFQAGEQEGVLFVTMRFVEGTDLGTVLHEEGRIEPDRAVAILAQVAAGLDEAHRHGMVHRDVKPPNVLLATRDGVERAYLTDFGLSRRHGVDDEHGSPGMFLGTADFIAPEQARGDRVDGRADVYALACVLFRAVTGRAPFERGSDAETLHAHLHAPIPSAHAIVPELPVALDGVLHRALAKQPEHRYPTAGAFVAEAQAALKAAGDGVARLRAVVADDSVLLRSGVVRILEDAGFDVVAQASDADELLRAVRAHHPDVALVDIRMPPTHTDEGVRAALEIRAEIPDTGVLVLSQHVEEDFAEDLFGDGLDGIGYLLKERVIDPRGFVESVRQVAAGGSALDTEIVSGMLARHRREGTLDALTSRERHVLARLAAGQSTATIAGDLRMAEDAVEAHVESIFAKLGLTPDGEERGRVLAVLAYLRA
jgi:serine/threonine-protein kinase